MEKHKRMQRALPGQLLPLDYFFYMEKNNIQQNFLLFISELYTFLNHWNKEKVTKIMPVPNLDKSASHCLMDKIRYGDMLHFNNYIF